jgi:vaccinia related kinase
LNSDGPVRDNAEFVMKLEPHDNGPLFCELHFYQRAAQPDSIKEWMKARSMKSLGVPKFIGFGNHEHNGQKNRFIVMQRFGTDLQKLFEQNGKRFPTHTAFLLGLKLLDVLEYLHGNDYVHADIKASNILTGYTDPHQVYLIDYGLAFRYNVDGKHKEYKEDPRKTHDGTVEFTSRDAHKGVAPSCRGDLEILGYCMLQWICGELPWENNLANKDYVRDKKIACMHDIPNFVRTCLPGNSCANEMITYLQLVSGLRYDQKPDYSKCRQIFQAAVKKLGHKDTDQLDFGSASSSGKAVKSTKKRANDSSPSRSPSNGISPPKVRRPMKSKSQSDIDGSDAENEDRCSSAQASAAAPAVKRNWPKAKNTVAASAVGAVKMADMSSPVAISKIKTAGAIGSSPVSTISPLTAGKSKLTPKSAKSTKGVAVVKRKRNVLTGSISTQTSPGLAGLARSHKR